MKTRRVVSLAALIVVPVALSAGLSACGDGSSIGADFAGNSGSGGGGLTGSVGVGGGFNGGGGSGVVPPPPPPEGTADAGTDAAPLACAALDNTKPVVLYLSADDSNSMASPVHAREMLSLGVAPLPNEVRTYEFLNYYHIQYAAPPQGQLAIFPELDATAAPGSFDFQIAVRSFDAVKPRRPMTITFVLDTSGSMEGPAIERERAAVEAIAQSLAPGDIVNMVTWNTSNNVVLSGHAVTGPNDAKVLSLANGLAASGGTDLHSGLVKGYELAEQYYGLQRMNRVVLISDGGANVGVTDADLIGQKSLDADKEGIYLVGIGAGPALGYADQLMDVVTDKGRGAYVYLDEPAEAARMFVDRFDETMEIAARGVQVELTMPWYFQMEKFYGEEYSTDPKVIEPQHLAPSDAMVLNQVLRACDPAEVKNDDTITVRARWKTPIGYAAQETEVTMKVGDLLAAQKPGLPKAKAIVAFAEALKAPSKQALADARAMAMAAGSNDPELAEIISLIEKHPQY